MPGEAQQAKDLLEVGVQEVLLLTLTRVRGGRAREDDQEPVPDLPFKKKKLLEKDASYHSVTMHTGTLM